jgi:ABC-2 type transport system ATP-binding protein
MVELVNLTKQFRRNGEALTAVNNVSLAIHRGEIFSLLGPNGAGKTTTISMMSGLIQPTSGDARIGGHSIQHEPLAAKRLLGVVPQDIALYLQLSARQNLEYFGRLYGLAGKHLTRRVDEVLHFIDLRDRQHDKVETFSGGMKRRVNIGVGLLHQPQLIFMDEPTVGIDPQNRRRVLDTVMRLRDDMGMTVLYTSHLMEEVQEISDRVGIIDHGEIIALGSVSELVQRVGEDDRIVFQVGSQRIPETVLASLRAYEGVTHVEYEPFVAAAISGSEAAATPTDDSEEMAGDGGKITVFVRRGRKALPHLIATLTEAGVEVQSVAVREPDLEAVFLHLTGRALRD